MSTPRTRRLQEPVRLSESILWDLQRAWYVTRGARAWVEGGVPTGASTHPALAHGLAHLVFGFLQDCLASGVPLDPSEPVYVIEAGAGHGRLAYLLALALERLSASRPAGLPPIVVVATDLAKSNLDFMQGHPFMEERLEAGQIDLAHLDLDKPGALTLRVSGARITPGSLANPVVVLGHYVLDSLRTDAFHVRGQRLHEVLLATHQSTEGDPLDLETYRFETVEREVTGRAYDDEALDLLVHGYEGRLDDAVVGIPVGGIALMRWAHSLGQGPTLLLVADKMRRVLRELEGAAVPGLLDRGVYSVSVNAHALSLLATTMDGVSMHADSAETAFTQSAFVLGASRLGLHATHLAFDAVVDGWSPRVGHQMAWSLVRDGQHTPETSLRILRLSGHDPWVWAALLDSLLLGFVQGDEAFCQQLANALARVIANVYPLHPGRRELFAVARGLQVTGAHADAVDWYEHALAFEGDHADTWLHLGECQQLLGGDPRPSYNKALALSPGWVLAHDRLAGA